ncbi:hypothetical protein Q3G72_023359 [Acer saccharum]|nr:hypothetical protein Q3G72_023359 [Acer saccharum]
MTYQQIKKNSEKTCVPPGPALGTPVTTEEPVIKTVKSAEISIHSLLLYHLGASFPLLIMSYVKKILKGSTGNWITFVLWIISISLDPLACYVPSIDDEKKLLKINYSVLIQIWALYWSLLIYRICISFYVHKRGQIFHMVESIALLFSNVLLYSVVLIPKMEIKSPVFSVVLGIFLAVYLMRIIGIYRLYSEEVTRSTSSNGFGTNLQVSTYTWENIFVVLIAIYGVGTFTYFIGNMQNIIKSAIDERRKKADQESKQQWFTFGKLSENMQNCMKECHPYNGQQTGGNSPSERDGSCMINKWIFGGLLPAVIESDAKSVVDIEGSGICPCADICVVLSDITSILSQFLISIVWVPRVSHAFAKLASDVDGHFVWIESCPTVLLNSLFSCSRF